MGKINYSKVEQMLQDALQKLQYKQLSEGKPIISARAQEFYGISKESRPVPEEVVEKLLDEESAAAREEEKKLKEERESVKMDISVPENASVDTSIRKTLEPFAPPTLPLFSEGSIGSAIDGDSPSIQSTPREETLSPARKRLSGPPKRPDITVDFSQTSDTFQEKVSTLYLLRQHLFWMKLQHLENRYEILRTSKEEIFAFRRKQRLAEDDLMRIKQLLQKAQEFRIFWLKKQGIDSPESLIERQKKKHKTKRFNIKEKWLPI